MAIIQAMGAVDQGSQVEMCRSAQGAVARNSPAAPGLVGSCNQLRDANVAAGRLLVDDFPVDPYLRTSLATRGETIVRSSPVLTQAWMKSPAERGFRIGVAVGSSRPPAGYASKVRASLSAADASAFDAGLAALSSTNSANQSIAADDGGVPRGVLIAGGVVGAVGIAALIYKFVL